jgi:hypothetical protein
LEFLDTSKGNESHRGAECWHRNKDIEAGIRKIIRNPETVENLTHTLTPAICVTSVDFMGFTDKEYHQLLWTIFLFLLILDSIVL